MKKISHLLALTLLFGLWTSTVSHAQTIVADNFDSATTNSLLNGRTPDVGSSNWNVISGTSLVYTENPSGTDGRVYTTRNNSSVSDVGILALPSEATGIIQLDANVRVLDVNWVGIGFLDGEVAFTNSSSQAWVQINNNGSSIILREYGTTILDTVSSGYTWNQFGYNDVSLIVDTDTRAVEVIVNGTSIITSTLSADPTISSTGFQFHGPVDFDTDINSRVRLDSISVSQIPEASSFGLLTGIVALMYMLRRRIRR